jgi:polygalacturonase
MKFVILQTTFCFLLSIFLGAHGMAATYSVRDYGAKADKTTNDQAAIQAAIDACHQAGGGEVVVPTGNYLAGKIILKSNVTLKLEAGATIWATDQMADYDRPEPGPRDAEPCLIEADGQEEIGVVGEGKIIGTGQAELARRSGDYRHLPTHRFGVIHFVNCKNVRLRDLEILFSNRHTVKFNECENVSVIGLSILNNYLREETDGIDPISSKNVLISNCHIVAGDDTICPKTERGIPLENLVVDNCILESVATAVKFGTGSSGVFRDVRVSNCVIRNSTQGIGLFIRDGGGVERASFSNISIETTTPDRPIAAALRSTIAPIFINLAKRNANTPLAFVHDVSFSDIQIQSDRGILIQAMPQSPIENLTLRNISFRVTRAIDFSKRTKATGGGNTYRDENTDRIVRQPAYIALAYINGLAVDDVRVLIDSEVFKTCAYSALGVFESKNAVISNVQREPGGMAGAQPVATLENCEQVLVTGCLALPGTPAFLGLAGEETKGIRLAGDDLSNAATPVIRDAAVPPDALSTPAAN